MENIKAARQQIKFKDAAIECIKSKKSEWSNPKHALQWESTLATYANSVLGASAGH
ncbi:phage integrase central domain-containing protein [Lampropedia aestuarii]|uniref:phage integrase central domain-containing protein n=1 Tax=Lampropedia aestuarii TaxID=2562762 RepID=UPI003CC82042